MKLKSNASETLLAVMESHQDMDIMDRILVKIGNPESLVRGGGGRDGGREGEGGREGGGRREGGREGWRESGREGGRGEGGGMPKGGRDLVATLYFQWLYLAGLTDWSTVVLGSCPLYLSCEM